MRAYLALAALAALVLAASAGPVEGPGCHSTDDIPKFPLKDGVFHDFVPGNFVANAYKQARARAIFRSRIKGCTKPKATPIRACYNSVIPGKLGPNQKMGQYGFVIETVQECKGEEVKTVCKIRINSLRNNRFLALSMWKGSQWDCKKIK